MDERLKVLVAVGQIAGAAAIPVLAFILRMLSGDVRNENEQVISDWLIKKTREKGETAT